MQDHYQLLGIDKNATVSEIAAAYNRRRAELLSQTDVSDVDVHLDMLEQAYQTLADIEKRSDYDNTKAIVAQTSALVNQDRGAQLLSARDAPVLPSQLLNCPHCGAENPAQAKTCAACNQQMTRPCPSCGQSVILGQNVCGRCQIVISEYDQRRYAEALMVEQSVRKERIETEAYAKATAQIEDADRRSTFIFWLIVLIVVIVLGLAATTSPGFFESLF